MSAELTLANARLVLADRVVHGSLAVRDGRIAAIDAGTGLAAGAVDLDGDLLVPGLVELHTDNLERHFEPRPGVAWPGKAAALAHDAQMAAAGVTTVLDAVAIGDILPNGKRDQFLDAMLAALDWGRADDVFRAQHLLHLRCEVTSEGVVEQFESLAGRPDVRLVSLMDHTPGQRQFADLGHYRRYYQGKHGFTEAEMDAFVEASLERQRRHGKVQRAAIAAVARARGLPLASHDDAAPAHVGQAIGEGAVLAEFPTTLEAARAAHGSGLAVLMGGPNLVLGGSHSGNVSAAALAEAGVLDVLSSDYVPVSLLAGVMLLAGPPFGLALPEALAMVTRTPARLVGLDDRGEIAPGLRADLVRVTPRGDGPLVRAVWRGGVRVA